MLFAPTTFKWQQNHLNVITKYKQILAQLPKIPGIPEFPEISQMNIEKRSVKEKLPIKDKENESKHPWHSSVQEVASFSPHMHPVVPACH